MPRRNRPQDRGRGNPERPREPRIPSTTAPIPSPAGWQAEAYRGAEPDRDYVCPRCERAVARSSQHVVAWRTDEDDRHRHWHTGCWRGAVREGLDRYRWL